MSGNVQSLVDDGLPLPPIHRIFVQVTTSNSVGFAADDSAKEVTAQVKSGTSHGMKGSLLGLQEISRLLSMFRHYRQKVLVSGDDSKDYPIWS